MRRVALVIAPVLLLAACGKSGGDQSTSTAAPDATPAAAPAAAAPAGPTDEQKKAILASLPAPYKTADLANGESKFALCKSCHSVEKGGADGVGPNLYGVFGRKAGSKDGYAYSDSVKALKVTWDAATIDKWITNPKAMAAQTKMTYMGMDNAKDRVDTVAYLKVVTTDPK